MHERPRSSSSKKNTLLAGALAMGAMAGQMEGCAPASTLRDQITQTEQAGDQANERLNLRLSAELDFLMLPSTAEFAHEVGTGLQPGTPEYVAFANLEEVARDANSIRMRIDPGHVQADDSFDLRSAIFQQAHARGAGWASHTVETADAVRHLNNHAEGAVFLRLATMARSPSTNPVALRQFATNIHTEGFASEAFANTHHRIQFAVTADEAAVASTTLREHWGNVGVSDASLQSVSVEEAQCLAATGISDTGAHIVHQLIEQHSQLPADSVRRIVLSNAYQAEGRLFQEAAQQRTE